MFEMAVTSNLLLLFLFANLKLNICLPGVLYKDFLPPVEDNFTMTSHLNYTHIKKVCSSRYSICKSNNTNVCGIRHFQNKVQYEDFENSCYMFMRNMCDNPGEEYYITSSGTCKDFFRNHLELKKTRRDQDDEEADEDQTPNNEEETNTEQEIEARPEQTEQGDENYTENSEQSNTSLQKDTEETTESRNENNDIDETTVDNQETENIETQDGENESEIPKGQIVKNNFKASTEPNEEEEVKPTEAENDVQKIKRIKKNFRASTEPNKEEEVKPTEAKNNVRKKIKKKLRVSTEQNEEEEVKPTEAKNDVRKKIKKKLRVSTEPNEEEEVKPTEAENNVKKTKEIKNKSFRATTEPNEEEEAEPTEEEIEGTKIKKGFKASTEPSQQEEAELTEADNDGTTQSVEDNIETVGDTGPDTTTPLSRIKHPKVVLRGKGKEGQAKNNKGPRTTTKSKSRTSTMARTNNKDNRTSTKSKPGQSRSTAIPQRTPKNPLKRTTRFRLYPVDETFDDHICPLSCPTTYSPVCVSANRGYGIHFKFFTFINHCFGYIYYCKHPEEFAPPPDEEENVVVSSLSWSFCAASRYIQFARFAEVTSSMGHYGWLAGNYRPTHIMEPHERIRGYG